MTVQNSFYVFDLNIDRVSNEFEMFGRNCPFYLLSRINCKRISIKHIAYTVLNILRPVCAGDYCQTKIQFCSKDFNPCHNGARCVDHTTHYSCECPLGFSGDNCTLNNDDCQNHMCQVRTAPDRSESRALESACVFVRSYGFRPFAFVVAERRSVRGRH